MVNELISTKYANKFSIYTDGSKIEGRTGYGIYVVQDKFSYSGRLKSAFTIMNAELIAILKAIDYIVQSQIQNAVIFTDSKSAAELIKNSNSSDNYIISDIYRKAEFLQAREIIIQWIPGHIQLTGNDRADYAAKIGTTREKIEEFPITKDDLILNLKNEIKCIWNQHYKTISEEKGIYHYKILQDIKLKPWFHKINLSAKHIIILSRLRTGHTATRDRLYKWGLVTTDQCDKCNQTEDIEHILYQCLKYANVRKKYPIIENKQDLQEILAKNQFDEIKQLAEFVKEIEISI